MILKFFYGFLRDFLDLKKKKIILCDQIHACNALRNLGHM